MTEVSNLDILTDKIYREGIEKAEKDSKAILDKAEVKRTELLEAARSEAQKTIAQAQREAARISRTVENELLLKGKQLISDLKSEVHQVLTQKVLTRSTKAAFADTEFLKSAILAAIDTWQPTNDLEVVLPKELEDKLEGAFHQSICDHAKNLTITFSNKLTGGFRIAEKDQGYQIAFSDEEFIALFKSYLDHQTEQLLFRQSV
ncbi:MAG: V-type ATP synthase subunit E [Cyclobacteriaceae bacterium]